MRMVKVMAGLALLVTVPAAAAATPKKADDPNREICKSKPVVGSRLKRIRECATAAQWEEMKLQERQGLLRRQTNGDPANRPLDRGGRDTPF